VLNANKFKQEFYKKTKDHLFKTKKIVLIAFKIYNLPFILQNAKRTLQRLFFNQSIKAKFNKIKIIILLIKIPANYARNYNYTKKWMGECANNVV